MFLPHLTAESVRCCVTFTPNNKLYRGILCKLFCYLPTWSLQLSKAFVKSRNIEHTSDFVLKVFCSLYIPTADVTIYRDNDTASSGFPSISVCQSLCLCLRLSVCICLSVSVSHSISLFSLSLCHTHALARRFLYLTRSLSLSVCLPVCPPLSLSLSLSLSHTHTHTEAGRQTD